MDLPKDEEDDVEMESVREEGEEQLTQTGMTCNAAPQSSTVLNFLHLLKVHLLLTNDLPQKLKAKAHNIRRKGQRLNGNLK